MDWKVAIQKMREITAEGDTFSFSHQTYSQKTGEGGQLRTVESASLRKQREKKDSDWIDPDLLLEYFNHDEGTQNRCYKHLIISFNGEKVTL